MTVFLLENTIVVWMPLKRIGSKVPNEWKGFLEDHHLVWSESKKSSQILQYIDPCFQVISCRFCLFYQLLFALEDSALLGLRCEESNSIKLQFFLCVCVYDYQCEGLSICMYSKHAFVCACVSSYLRHSRRSRLFLVLKDCVCVWICTCLWGFVHNMYACVCVSVPRIYVCVLAVDWRAGLGGCGEFVCLGLLVWKSSQSCASPWREGV